MATAAVMVAGAGLQLGVLVSGAAALFAFAVAVVASVINFEAWRRPPSHDPFVNALRGRGVLVRNALIGAMAYGWGALAMAALYVVPLTGLKWQHGWQYALAMALLAGLSLAYARTFRPPHRGHDPAGWRGHFALALPFALTQGLVAAGGLAFLTVSGKLAMMKADWAANRVFAALAVAILAVSIASAVTRRRVAPIP